MGNAISLCLIDFSGGMYMNVNMGINFALIYP